MSTVERSNKVNSENLSAGSSPRKAVSKCFRYDRLVILFGTALLLSGIALLILKSIYPYNLYAAGVTCSSVGATFFFFGLTTTCCFSAADGIKKMAEERETKGKVAKNRDPIPLGKSTSDFLQEKGVYGLPQKLIDEIEIWRRYRADEELGIPLDGLLLYGPPGTGKTSAAKAIAKLLGGECHLLASGDLKSKFLGSTDKKITKLFDVPKGQFRVIVIDEIDGLLAEDGGEHTQSIVSHFKGVVSGAENKKPRYLLIGTTNKYENIPQPLRRPGRLGQHFEITNLDLEAREKLIKAKLNRVQNKSVDDWDDVCGKLVEFTVDMSGSDITGIFTTALKKAFLEGRPVKREDFLKQFTNDDFR